MGVLTVYLALLTTIATTVPSISCLQYIGYDVCVCVCVCVCAQPATPDTAPLLQILPAAKSMKPQASHLQTRVEYLLKLLQSEARKAKKKVRR